MAWRSSIYEGFAESAKNDNPMPAGVEAWKKEMDAKSAGGDKLKSFGGGDKVKAQKAKGEELDAAL